MPRSLQAGCLIIAAGLMLHFTACFDRKVDRSGLVCEPGLSEPCYTGLPFTRGIGECRAGTLLCWEEDDEAYQACEWEVTPATEKCDGLDNDCDGVPDDDGACALQAFADLEADLGPLWRLPSPEGSTSTVIAGSCWSPVYNCPLDQPPGECHKLVRQKVAASAGLVDIDNEIRFIREIHMGSGLSALVYGQVFDGVEVEGGAIVLLLAGRDVFSVLSAIQPVRRNLPTPVIQQETIADLLPVGAEVLASELVLTSRQREDPIQPLLDSVADGSEFTSEETDAGPVVPPPLPGPEEDQWIAWRIDYLESIDSRRAYIDAITGELHLDFSRNFPLTVHNDDPAAIGTTDSTIVAHVQEKFTEFQSYVSRVPVYLNAAETDLLTNALPKGTQVEVYYNAERLKNPPSLVGMSEDLSNCTETCGWYAMGTGQIHLCGDGQLSRCGNVALPHELSHLMFDGTWEVNVLDSSAVSAIHAMIDIHALTFLCDLEDETPSNFEWVTPFADYASFEPAKPCHSTGCTDHEALQRFGRSMSKTIIDWETIDGNAVQRFQHLLYNLLAQTPNTPMALAPQQVASWLLGTCHAHAYTHTSNFTPEHCTQLANAMDQQAILPRCLAPICREFCNGIDDNCDFHIDNCSQDCLEPDQDKQDYSLLKRFYTGPEEAMGVGICREGVNRCSESGWVTETQEILPTPCAGNEAMCGLCNGADDNCDGVIDETCPCLPDEFMPRPCGKQTGEEPWCTWGTQVCVPGETDPSTGVLVCTQAPTGADSEVCDGLDNDCDGMIDEDTSDAGLLCPADAVGACSAGTTACMSGQLLCLPGTPEDNDGCSDDDLSCDGTLHEDWIDKDGDGFFKDPGYDCPNIKWDCLDQNQGKTDASLVHPGAMLVCGYYEDSNCDGVIPDKWEDEMCICVEKCEGKNCGDNGCGGTCGVCSPGEVCNSGLCKCSQPCGSKECGFDLCGNGCGKGICGYGFACINGQCHDAAGSCLLQCGGTTPGGVSCPDVCPPGYMCGADHKCVCAPQCDGKTCGPNMCGGSCGDCPEFMKCNIFFECQTT